MRKPQKRERISSDRYDGALFILLFTGRNCFLLLLLSLLLIVAVVIIITLITGIINVIITRIRTIIITISKFQKNRTKSRCCCFSVTREL